MFTMMGKVQSFMRCVVCGEVVHLTKYQYSIIEESMQVQRIQFVVLISKELMKSL